MARPRRCRRVCAEPVYGSFCPAGNAANGEVMLTLDEYEAIRLIDLEKLTWSEFDCGLGEFRFEMPTVADMAVIRALKGEMSPAVPSLRRPRHIIRKP